MGSKKRRVKFAAGIVTVKDTQAHPVACIDMTLIRETFLTTR
jgi:hypothetical protein